MSNLNNIVNVAMSNIDMRDYPDFVDAYIEYAEWGDTGKPLTDDQLDKLNENESEFVQMQAHKEMFG